MIKSRGEFLTIFICNPTSAKKKKYIAFIIFQLEKKIRPGLDSKSHPPTSVNHN